MKQLILIFFIFSGLISGSQNLVLNPSFEDYNRCPWEIGRFSSNVKHWSIPNLGSTDFFSFCSEAVGYNNYIGYQIPKDGQSYVGIYALSPNNYREYIQGKLSATLEKGKAYTLRFYISLAENSTEALKNIDVLFTEESLGFTTTNKTSSYKNVSETFIKPKKYTDKSFQLYSMKSDTFYNDRIHWMEVALEFIAEGYEANFSIGNFSSNKKTVSQEILKTTKNNQQFSYYYIDEVSIELIKKEKVEDLTIIEELSININEIHTFKNVFFDFDKAELLNESIEELNQLYEYLKVNSNLKVEINGHTDAIGLETRNQELSKQRAKAVADYLIAQGLDATRIKSYGFGSTQPISTNETEEGRQLNRRVTFKLIKK